MVESNCKLIVTIWDSRTNGQLENCIWGKMVAHKKLLLFEAVKLAYDIHSHKVTCSLLLLKHCITQSELLHIRYNNGY